ncbi:MAG: DUF1080 domain-containing protein [Planctomycetes bacterium]|nr:DUF1080 domain-containing protein [Planctomycetota bacterium]
MSLSLLFAALSPFVQDASLAALEVPAGLEVSLWAESPRLYNPTAMDVDASGRLWVTEAVNYRKWGGRNPGLEHPGGDRVVVLEDTDGDGRCDRSTVFAQDADLVAPLGILVLGEGRVLVSCSPNAWLYTDSDGDLVADRREVFLTGFGGFDHDHGLHSFVAGPDGRWYAAAGNAGPHIVQDRDGWTLRSGSIYVGGGPQVADNKPGLVSDDGRVWTGGLVLRVGPDARGLAVLAHDFRNDYEVALDSFGNLFVSDNDDDGNQSCRTAWVMEGGDYGYFAGNGSRTWGADRRPEQPTPRAHWHADDPGVMPSGTINGAGGPTGVCVYEGALLADWIDGAVLNADAGRNVVYAHRPRAVGAGVELEPGWLVRTRPGASGERASWFRPSDVCVGTDGAVYVADWYDPGVGGHGMGDREAYGRILRIAPAGAPTAPVKLDPRTPQGAFQALRSPAPSVRAQGAAGLLNNKAIGQRLLTAAAARDADRRVRARALWLLAAYGPRYHGYVEGALYGDDVDLRITALRALRAADADTSKHWARLAQDPSPAVRRELLVTLRDVPLEACEDALLELAARYDGADRTYLEAFGYAVDGEVDELFPLLAADFGDPPARWDARFAGLVWRLHPAAAVEGLKARAMTVTVPLAERRRALDALAFVKDRSAGEAMLDLAQVGPEDTRGYAQWWIRNRDANDWRAYKLLDQLGRTDLSHAEKLWESGVITAGARSVSVDVRGAQRLWLVAGEAGDGNGHDWADWIEPELVGDAGTLRLTDIAWTAASAGWGAPHVNGNALGAPLSVEGVTPGWGLGTHARSVIEYALPPGYHTFRCRVAPDDGGVTQPGANTSIAFEVYAQRARDRSALLARERTLLDEQASPAARAEAAAFLAADAEGGLMLIQHAKAGALTPELERAAAGAIFANPDLAVRALASEVFRRPGEETAALPSLDALLALEGDPARGARLFRSTEAQCSSCHTYAGLGGEVGPELTAIHTKYAPRELFDAILNPSAAIAFGYDSWVLSVKDIGLLSGFVLADGETVVLKDTSGLRHVIPAGDIEARTKQALSTMPQGVALGLGAQGIADLVAFLAQDPAAQPVYGPPVRLFDGQDLAGWTWYLSEEGADPAATWTVKDGVLRCEGRPIGYLRTEEAYTNFTLTLEWRFDPAAGPGNSGVLLRMIGEDKVWPKSIECQLHHQNAGDIWNIDKFPMRVDEARTNGRRTTKLAPSSEKPLGEWNRYEITIDRGELRLVVNGVLQNTASWCDEVPGFVCLQSEGAVIEFRDIVLQPIVGHVPR